MDKEIFLSYYGDDFTGSADVMEALTTNGIPAALFLKAPSEREVKNFRLKNTAYSSNGGIKAFGVAGISRTMSVEEMKEELSSIFKKISQIPSTFFHYKICSTFDSAPDIGNIGCAANIAVQYFPSKWIPLIVGAPALNRFCVFGNLFARAEGTAYRLDRHPTMSKHPVTPMHESDLRIHLSAQTDRKSFLVDVLALAEEKCIEKDFDRFLKEPIPPFVLFDVLDHTHLSKIGALVNCYASGTRQLIVGSSSVEYALCSFQQTEQINSETSSGKAERLIVIAGSCSPGTQKQIEWAVSQGFEGIRIKTVRLADPDTRQEEIQNVVSKASEALGAGKHIVLYTALGPDDKAIKVTKELMKVANTYQLGELQGTILKQLLKKYGKARIVTAGGDTSGHIARALGIYALELLTPIAPGAPLCLAHSFNPEFDGLEIALKGGQNGNEKYFTSVLKGMAE